MTIYFDSFFVLFVCSFYKYRKTNSRWKWQDYRFGNIIGGYWVYVCIFLVCPLYFDSWSFVQSWFYPSFFFWTIVIHLFCLCFHKLHAWNSGSKCLDLTIDNWSIFQFLWGCCINECTFNKCKLCFHYFIKNIY